jgi:hypothetical protein
MRGGQDRLGQIVLAFMHDAIPTGLTEAVFVKEQTFTNFVGLCHSPQDGLSISHVTERHAPNLWLSRAARGAGLAVWSRLEPHTRPQLTPLAGPTDGGGKERMVYLAATLLALFGTRMDDPAAEARRHPGLDHDPATAAHRRTADRHVPTAIDRNLPHGLTISRRDVAHLKLTVLQQPDTIRNSVGVAY